MHVSDFKTWNSKGKIWKLYFFGGGGLNLNATATDRTTWWKLALVTVTCGLSAEKRAVKCLNKAFPPRGDT